MIHIVDAANMGQYRREMEEVWHLRHKVFVEEKGWTELAKPDGREIDQFDTPEAVHLLAMEGGKVIGYSRLLPTIRPHLLSEVFPHLCEGDLPRGPRIWEWTRQAVAPAHRARGTSRLVTVRLMAGIVEWGMANGVTSLVTMMPLLYLLPFLDTHFRAVPLGLPTVIDGERTIAVRAEFDMRTLKRLRAMRGDPNPVLATPQVSEYAA